jgi:hypothetical protein
MVLKDTGRFRHYNNPGAFLYVKESIVSDPRWPFKEGEWVKIYIDVENGRVVEEKAKWYDVLVYKFPGAYELLPQEIKEIMMRSGILPELGVKLK